MIRSLAAAAFAVVVSFTQVGLLPAAPKTGSETTAGQSGSAETTSGSPALEDGGIPRDIPVGNADDDPVTSRAIFQILRETAKRYATVKNLRATGTYIEGAKVEQSGKAREEQSASRLEILYRRPDRLRIMVTGAEVAAGFVANGKTITMLWPNRKQYRQIPQTESLAAFAEEERAGEILEDDSNAIVYSVVGALLISEDPLRWLHANVKTYVFDGVENVHGRPAWRIKFLQDDPAIVVINWVDQETKLLSKVSIIQARDTKGDFVESYGESAYGRIRIAMLDNIQVDLPAISDKDFQVQLGRDWKAREGESTGRTARTQQVSPWERLVRAAAAKKGAETSPTLTAQVGGTLLRLGRAMERPSKVTGLAYAGEAAGEGRSLAAATESQIAFLGHEGRKLRDIPIRGRADLMTVMNVGGTTDPVLATATNYGDTVRGYALDGRPLWSYERSGARISSMIAARPPESDTDFLYTGYLGGNGFRVLRPDGGIQMASRQLSGITALAAGDIPGSGWRVVASTGTSGGFFGPDGRFLSKLPEEDDSDTQVGLLAIDNSQASAPLLQVAGVGETEYVLRRVRPDNSPVWTVPLAQDVKEAEPVGLVVARLKLPDAAATAGGDAASTAGESATTETVSAEPPPSGSGEPRPCAVALLSDGRLSVISAEGKVLWRGKAVFGGAASSGDLEHTASALLAADLNADGEDEIYVGGEGYVLQVVTGE